MVAKRTVLITGASRGIGAETAKSLAQQGINVVLFARSEADLVEVAQQVGELGGNALIVVGDVSRREDCQRAVRESVETFGGLQAVVNNAGVIQPINAIANADIKDWVWNWEVNFLGPLMVCQSSLPHLRKQAGRVVNISSGAALRAIRGWAAYSTAKAALDHLTLILAAEEKDVVSVGLRPGVVDTAMQVEIVERGGEGMPQDEHQKFVKQKQDGKLISPSLPGRAAAALALHAPKDWSGQTVVWNDEQVEDLVGLLKA
jgi:NAD(P)-dependent dehydrogenase (short-subunit alcohol dehydrogenase family)